MPDAPGVLASDAERERALVRLRDAVGEGRLEELADRVEAALGARTRAELDAITADLQPGPPAQAERRPGTRWVLGIMGGNDLEASGLAPGRGAPTVRVRAYSIMGGTDVVVSSEGGSARRRLGPPPPPPPL